MCSRILAFLALGLLFGCGNSSSKEPFGGLSAEPWSAAAVDEAAREGQPVVILATADW